MMLERMKQGTAKIVGSIFAALLIVAMAAWGVEDYLRVSRSDTTLASVGDTDITVQEFDRQYRQAVDRLRARLGPSMDAARARQFGIAEGTLQNMIDRQLIALEAGRLGLLVSDQTVAEQIRDSEAFRGPGGTFDRVVYEQTLRNAGLSEGEYVAALRGDMVQGFLMDAVTTGSVAPPPLTSELYRYGAQTRTAEVAILPRESAGEVGEPDESALAEFHKTHAARFTAPEYRKISAIVLDPTAYAEKIKPEEAAVREAYQSRLPSLRVPERRELRQFLFTDGAKAADAARRLEAGETMEAVAKAEGGANPIDLGLVSKQEVAALSPELAEAVFATAEGKTTKPVQTSLGWHVVEVEKVQPGSTPTFEEVREIIARDLARDQAVDQLVEVANRVEDAIASGATLAEAAERVGVPLRRYPSIDAQGRNRAGEPVADVPKDGSFLRTAFDAPEGEIGYMEELENGGYFILSVESITAPALRPLAEVRDQVVEAWKQEQQTKIVSERAKKLAEAVNAGTPLAQAAKEAGYETFTSDALTRRGDREGKFPPSLVQDLFRLEPGEAAAGPTANGFAVVQLKSVEDPSLAENKDEVERFKAAVSQGIRSDLAEQFSMALRDRFTVLVDQQALNNYLDRYTVR